jgi:hypothetical protein
LFHRIQDFGGWARLVQQLGYSSGTRQPVRYGVRELPGQEDDSRPRRLLLQAQSSDQLIAIHAWHHQVGDDQLRVLALGNCQGLIPVARFKAAMVFALQEPCKKSSDRGIIICDQNSCHINLEFGLALVNGVTPS